MEWTIRQELPTDYAETEALTREAFWNQYAPGCSEHYLLHILRDSPAFVPELDLVAVHQGRVIGNVVCVRAVLHGDDGRDVPVLTLGPLSVLPEFQSRGVGGQLIQAVRERARELGYPAILLCGAPAYYVRQGFLPAESLGIRTADNQYLPALQVCELTEGALAGAAGRYCEDAVYSIDEADAAAFDRQFPPRERVTGTPSQQRLLELVAQARPAD